MSSEDNKNINMDSLESIKINTLSPKEFKDPWDEWVETFQNYEKYCNVPINNGIPTVLTTEFTKEMADAITKVTPDVFGLGTGNNNCMSCRTCQTRLRLLLRMRDSNGNPFFMAGSNVIYPEKFMPLWHASRTGSVTAVLVVEPFQFGMYSTGKWNHFSIGTVTTIPDIKDSKNRQRLLDKYIPIATKLFTDNGVIGIHSSLDTLIATLPSVTYGVKLLESATWFRKHIIENFGQVDRRTQLNILTSAIFDLNYCNEIDSGDVTIPLYHQLSKNTLDALAVCNSVEQLTALLKDRISPLTYQVKTVEASVGQVNMAMKHIGDFETELMTLENAIKHGAIEVKQTSQYSASSAFSKMKVSSNGSQIKSGAAGFASRSNLNVKFIKTMKDLMTILNEKKLDGLDVYVDQQTPVYATDFIGLKEGVYQTSHSWGFVNGVSPKEFNMRGWQKVVAILKMKTNFMFICEGALPNSIHMEPCCHVGLLTAEYNKSCGSAFGNLKSHMKLQINGKGPFAIGVGVSLNAKSLTDPNPPINGSITLRSCGTEFIIR
jgi:hypothetical protein